MPCNCTHFVSEKCIDCPVRQEKMDSGVWQRYFMLHPEWDDLY
jgi:hypothetical protein